MRDIPFTVWLALFVLALVTIALLIKSPIIIGLFLLITAIIVSIVRLIVWFVEGI